MQDGQDKKKLKENQASKVTKIPKTKRRKYGMNEIYVLKTEQLTNRQHEFHLFISQSRASNALLEAFNFLDLSHLRKTFSEHRIKFF